MTGITLNKNVKVEIDREELFGIVVNFSKKHPKVIKAILDALLKGDKIKCPFPFDCSSFPCKSLNCNADVCSNGYAYRMS
jgi:hypothetical protein